MAKIRHIAITTEKPEEAAAFYKEAFDMQEIIRNDRQVLLSDGYINLTILKWKTGQDADVGPAGSTPLRLDCSRSPSQPS